MFGNKPLVSVIIPSRVGEEIESLPSIKKQTYKNLDVIVEYDKNKEGAAITRNRGYARKKGKLVFFCDNDISLFPDALDNLYAKMKETGAKWVFGRVMIDGYDVTKKKGAVPKNKHSVEYAYHFHGISTMSLIDASALEEFGANVFDPTLKRFIDWDLWIRLDKAGYKGAFLDKLILTTKNRPGGISSGGKKDFEKSEERIFKKHEISRKIADIVIPHHNRHDHLEKCLEGIDNRIFNIIIVSGGTFAENCNKGAKLAVTDNIIFLNDDVETKNEVLVELATADYDYCSTSQFINGIKYHAIGWNKTNLSVAESFLLSRKPEDNLIPSGYCFKVRRDVWEKLGGLNEEYKNGAEDCDLGFRALEMGLNIGYIDRPMVHHHSQSDGRFAYTAENNLIFNERWKESDIMKFKGIKAVKPSEKEHLDIVISGASMGHLSGQPMYCYELARQLKKDGHNITVVSDWKEYHGKEGHFLKDNLEKEGILCLDWKQVIVGKKDLWIVSEGLSTPISIDAPILNVIHSEYDEESPIKNIPVGYICIRPSILEHIVKEHNIPREKCYVVYNGIDRERFKKKDRIKRNYKKIVIPCTHTVLKKKFMEYMAEIANESEGGIKVEFHGPIVKCNIKETDAVKFIPDSFHIENAIVDADEVAGVLLGRVNLEANSCGIPSMIYDPVTLESRPFFMGEEAFDKRHNIKNVSKQIIEIARNIIDGEYDCVVSKIKNVPSMPANTVKKESEKKEAEKIRVFKVNPVISNLVNTLNRKRMSEEESTIFRIAHSSHLQK